MRLRFERPAQRSSELVSLVAWFVLSGRSEEVARVQCAVAQELVSRAVELISSALEHHVELPAAVASERSVVAAGRHFELAHRVHWRRYGDAVQLGVAVVDAVEQEVVGVIPARR